MKENKIKINIPVGNPDDGYKKRRVKARIIHHELEDKFTFVGFKDKRVGGRYTIVELTTGMIVAMGRDKSNAMFNLHINYKTESVYGQVIKTVIAMQGIFNKSLERNVQ